jgi:hypothetical protein
MVWQLISAEVSVEGCMKCCVFTAVDDTANDMLWNGDVGSVWKMKPIVKYIKHIHLVSEK